MYLLPQRPHLKRHLPNHCSCCSKWCWRVAISTRFHVPCRPSVLTATGGANAVNADGMGVSGSAGGSSSGKPRLAAKAAIDKKRSLKRL